MPILLGSIFEVSLQPMKKIDKLIISSFLGPFILTLLVVVFILLMKQMLIYFDDIIGKGLEWGELGSLMIYFSVTLLPSALPLAVLMSSLITFGNLGEHFELTAIKSLGISLTRSLLPLFFLVVVITIFSFFANNYLVPRAALEAYSLLYDIKQKKPALDIKEGSFYNGIPDISIKVNRKFRDGITLKGVIIYDHRGRVGNKKVTVADSGKMFTMLNDQYLKLELFNGYDYTENSGSGQDETGRPTTEETYSKTKFSKMQVVLDLSSFGMNRTDTKWFKGNRIMRNVAELDMDMDSISGELATQKIGLYHTQASIFSLHFKRDSLSVPKELKDFKRKKNSLAHARVLAGVPPSSGGAPTNYSSYASNTWNHGIKIKIPDSITRKERHFSDSLYTSKKTDKSEISSALNKARMVKSQLQNYNANTDGQKAEYVIFRIQWHRILSNSIACLAMFLIGAPLGSIIKKGGLGVPVLVSILFFILFYVLDLLGVKWAKQDLISVPTGVWMANIILFSIGMLFLRQARVDARLFDADFYHVVIDKLKKRIAVFRAVPKVEGQPG
jgi:lipopolysaccharide export system permease protein